MSTIRPGTFVPENITRNATPYSQSTYRPTELVTPEQQRRRDNANKTAARQLDTSPGYKIGQGGRRKKRNTKKRGRSRKRGRSMRRRLSRR